MCLIRILSTFRCYWPVGVSFSRPFALFVASVPLALSSYGQVSESIYVYEINAEVGGETEVVVTSGRVDIVTETHAFEVEMANNWKEAIGQALWYGLQTDKKSCIVLVKETAQDFKYVQQLQSTIAHAGLSDQIEVRVYPDDFPLAARAHEYEQPIVPLQALSFDKEGTGTEDVKGKTKFWLTKKSKKRHNKNCKIYEQSKGRYCLPTEGTPAGCCGG